MLRYAECISYALYFADTATWGVYIAIIRAYFVAVCAFGDDECRTSS